MEGFAPIFLTSRPQLFTLTDFGEKAVEFFRSQLNDRVSDQCRMKEIIRQSREHFQSYLIVDEFADIYIEVLFSVFEGVLFTDKNFIRDCLEDFMFRKLRSHSMHSMETEKDLPLRYPPVPELPYDVDPSTGKSYSVEKFYVPVLVLDLHLTQRLLRYGCRIEFDVLQMHSSLFTVLRGLA